MRAAAALVSFLVGVLGGCQETVPLKRPNGLGPNRLGVTPGVFILVGSVPVADAADLLNREVVALESGGVGIVLGESHTAVAPQEGPEHAVPAFDSLAGQVTVNHQTAYLVERTSKGSMELVADARIRRMESSLTQTSQIGDGIEHLVSSSVPSRPEGSAYVRAVAVETRYLCTRDFECAQGTFREREVVAIAVGGVAGPPGFASIEISPSSPSFVNISLRTHPWVRIVVHAMDSSGTPPVLVESMSRHEAIRGVRPHRFWGHPASPRHGLRFQFEPFVYRSSAPVPRTLDAKSITEFRVTYLDWRVPDVEPSTLADWDAWTDFVDALGPELARTELIPAGSESSP